MLHLEVRDNGEGLKSLHGSIEEGVGLSNTRARLAELYGDRHRFELRNASDGGLIVEVVIPCRIELELDPAAPSPNLQSIL
jgi:sensor histidine kinase YesM